MIRGKRIYLTALDRDNAETARAWINDPDIHKWLTSGHIPVSSEDEQGFYDRAAASDDTMVFEIHLADDDRYIGNCGLEHVDMRNRSAEIGILIGELDLHNNGYGRDAIETIAGFAFDTLGLHSLRIGYIEANEVGAHLYRSIGFRDAGRQRERMFLRGEFHDLVMLDTLDSEWRETRM